MYVKYNNRQRCVNSYNNVLDRRYIEVNDCCLYSTIHRSGRNKSALSK